MATRHALDNARALALPLRAMSFRYAPLALALLSACGSENPSPAPTDASTDSPAPPPPPPPVDGSVMDVPGVARFVKHPKFETHEAIKTSYVFLPGDVKLTKVQTPVQRLTLGRDRSFLLEGTLAPRGSSPPELARSLALLGPADAGGRRPVSVSGTF